MKRIDLGQTMQTLANVGVIVGIIFLVVELQQNNRLLTAQASYNLLQNRATDSFSIYQSPEIGEFWAKVNRGDELTDAENVRLDFWAAGTIMNWNWEYGQYLDGNLAEEDLPVAAWRANFQGEAFRRQTRMRERWDYLRNQLNPAFVEFMERDVIPK